MDSVFKALGETSVRNVNRKDGGLREPDRVHNALVTTNVGIKSRQLRHLSAKSLPHVEKIISSGSLGF